MNRYYRRVKSKFQKKNKKKIKKFFKIIYKKKRFFDLTLRSI